MANEREWLTQNGFGENVELTSTLSPEQLQQRIEWLSAFSDAVETNEHGRELAQNLLTLSREELAQRQ